VTDVIDRLRTALGDRYTLERQVGEGGMAVVYKATDLKHERTVAVKVLRQELSVSLGADRFLREIRVAANLQHPNILGLYDSGEAEGLLFYVMPFVEGESLRDRLNKEQQLPLHDALQIVREAAEALQYAHEHKIVHRDIKPENILLLGGHALVADFGIARAVSSAGGEKLTQTGMAVGTPHYMSPEQALGSEHVDARSDVYSLGCVLYELLIGQPPFTGPNAMAIMARHSMEVVPSLQVVRASVPDEVEDVVMQALEKTPADRFQTMKEFAERLSDAEAEAAMMRTAQRRASTAARRASGARTGAQAARRTGSQAVPAVERRTPVDVAAAAFREGGVKFWSLAVGGLVLLGAAGFGVWKFTHGAAGGAAAEETGLDPNRIAVLYFEKGRGTSDSLNYLADGITEALIHELSAVGGLQVISSNGVRPYRKGDVPLVKIAQDLKVGTLVHGDVTESADKLRVTVSMANAGTGVEIGSTTIERPRSEVFALQDEVSKEVAVFLRKQIGKEVVLRETRGTTKNVDAWATYQKAQAEARDAETLSAAGDSAGAARKVARTDSLLAHAEQLDPQWVAPPTLRGWLSYRQSRMAPLAEPSYHMQRIQEGLGHAERALKLKPDDPDALELRGTLRYWQWLSNLTKPSEAEQLYADAEHDLRASVEANPQQASAWTSLSHLLINKPAEGEAKLAAMRAYDADPYLSNANVTIWRLFSTSFDLEDAVEAKRWCEEGQQRFPKDYRFAECRLWLPEMKAIKPDIPATWKALDEYVQLSPPSMRPFNQLLGQMRVAIALARAGMKDSARSVAQKSGGDPTIDSNRNLSDLAAQAYLILGDKDAAIKELSVYLAANPQGAFSGDAWWFRDLRDDPRYRALIGAK